MGARFARHSTAAAAVVGVALVVSWQMGPASADSRPTSGTLSTSATVSHATEYPDFAPVPADTVRGLAALGVDVSDPGVGQSSVVVPLDRAVEVARTNAPLAGVPADQGVASLATVTTREFGVEMAPDPIDPSVIDPAIDHELTWVVTFTSVPGRLISGRPAGTVHGNAVPSHGTVVAFVSPETGKFLYGLAF